uniref:Uncharacterized protein n=1 Tax=Solanum tuberosum TaxID=4113 RepID=M1DQ62_SOLTU
MSQLRPLEVWLFEQGNAQSGFWKDFGQFRKIRVHARLGEKRKEEKGEEEARFVDFVKDSLWISSGVIPKKIFVHMIWVHESKVNLGKRIRLKRGNELKNSSDAPGEGQARRAPIAPGGWGGAPAVPLKQAQ